MEFMECLDFSNVKNDQMDELKNSNFPILVYGGGSFARDILHYLKSAEICVEGVFVDEGGFVLPDILEDYGIKQISMNEIDSPCYIVMGMANYLKGKTLVNENIRKIFYLSFYPYGDKGVFSKEDIEGRKEAYQTIYDILADDLSKKCMISYLNARIKNDASCVFPCYEREQTYFDNTVFQVSEGDNYIDIGAYTGDTIQLFYEACNGKPGKIWAFEGDGSLEPTIRNTILKLGIEDQTELFMTGLWSERKQLFFAKTDHNVEEGTITSKDTGLSIDTDSVDNILQEKSDRVDIIKINFANADEVIKGCKRIITEDQPRLAVVVGFFDKLICDVPRIIIEMDASYKIYFRYNSEIPAKLVMYAVPNFIPRQKICCH